MSGVASSPALPLPVWRNGREFACTRRSRLWSLLEATYMDNPEVMSAQMRMKRSNHV